MSKREPEERFQALVEEHKKILYKVCHSYCKNPGDRDDLAQEILFQLWRSFGVFDERVRFSTWMYRIALNVAISFYRRESVRARHVVSVGEGLLENVAEARGETEEIQILYRWIGDLDPLNKALVILYLDGHSYSEIALVLGITEANVGTKIGRIKERLRQEAGAQHGTR
ncbi:MAG TPA: RNA polymerase sigma factor [Bryobacteraceae bacterium]|nr:RNA polymerase sigma factor [Bryobacteraceae bacterium]